MTKMEILFVEDGSIDTTELDALGINYIVCRQGSEPPKIVEVSERRLQQKYINEINAMSFEFSIYRRALELACETLNRVGVRHPYVDYDYYIHQAEKELEEQK